MTARPLLLGLLLSSGLLTGCGKTGMLEQPAPLFGADAKANYEAQKKADADAKARAAAARKAESTAPIVDDPDGRPMTNGTMPQVPGAPSNPFASGPQGALPSPATSPNP